MEEVTLQQVLSARDSRAARQQAMLEAYGKPLVSFTMNIPGPVKNTPLIRRAFRRGMDTLTGRLTGILAVRTVDAPTGCEGLWAVDMDERELKALCTAIEDASPLGRLFDMDVLGADGRKLDRETVRGSSRNCIVCGAAGRSCAARRVHSVPELQAATRKILQAHFAAEDPETIAGLAVRSLREEVDTTPKPGLVDRRNNGSHTDMDLSTFYASAEALRPYFRDCVRIGMETAALLPAQTFPRLRQAGILAEAQMYRTTGGVNTHKGAIYTLGILCGSIGRLWKPETPLPDTNALLAECGQVAESAAKADLARLTSAATAGEALFLSAGLRGIRGEAADGLPSVREYGLPVFRTALAQGRSRNDAGVLALLSLIANVEDTNLHHRGGLEGARFAAKAAADLLADFSTEKAESLDEEFIRRNLSPGGCADLLAVTYFLDSLAGME